jgi:iron complex outermembrane receptor protein
LPSERQSLWFAVSRAARNPMRVDADVRFVSHTAPPNVPVFLDLTGNPEIQPENLIAYELGYRAAPTDYFTWDIASYINDYNKLRGIGQPGLPVFQPPGVFIPVTFENNMRALSYGFETTAAYTVNPCWRLFATYSLFEISAEGENPVSVALIEGSSPHNMIYLRSSHDIRRNLQFDMIGRYVDRLTALAVPSYFEMDTRIAWQATDSLEFSVVGQNLLNSHHLEFRDVESGTVSTQMRRSWYGMVTWSF